MQTWQSGQQPGEASQHGEYVEAGGKEYLLPGKIYPRHTNQDQNTDGGVYERFEVKKKSG